jgi:hypothetical protein
MTTIINGSSPSITFSDGSAQTSATRPFLNRIINGAMVLSQRNGTSAVTIDGGASYTLDRYLCQDNTDGSYTVAQSSTAPTGFINSLLVTITGTDSSLTTTQFGRIVQRIEGFNTADLAWGTASAKTVTLSFWVRSSVTGTFSGTLVNDDANRIYAFTYTISVADTWEQKTVTIAGDTSGTWKTTNATGIELNLSIGAGPDRTVAAGSWGTSLAYAATGQTNLFATNGATFYITGVQLEVGSTATSFDYRPYGTEFDLCRRYYEQYNYTNAGGANQYIGSGGVGMAWTGTDVRIPISYYPKRASATCAFSGTIRFATNAFGQNFTSVTFDNAGVNTVLLFNGSASGFTAGQAQQVTAQAANTYISISAEL